MTVTTIVIICVVVFLVLCFAASVSPGFFNAICSLIDMLSDISDIFGGGDD